MKKLFLTLVILFLSTLYLSADTYIPGGDVSGTWELTGSPFYIEGEITIPSGETLYIEPGVDVIFNGYYKFIVNGFIEAIGTEADSILFTAADPVTGWHSLRFFDAPDNSHLSYCIIEYGNATGEIPDGQGGGIYCMNSNPVITYCTISDNTAEMSGGGIACESSSPQILNCTIIYNNSFYSGPDTHGGGGIGCIYSNPLISNCTIKGNTANNPGGGIAFAHSDFIIEYCDIM
ncbi:MAG: right-handed parallel beta-helix repeat-containing protein, partial [Candidatus Cloacimonetes bacterium]|nr:right-handed parallel beta-helix repeat-containing protein [Candidatus Cloacimonadota bacterium]